jgi:hypothetical protein
MYASKIANYAHENKVNPNANLSLNLHFLWRIKESYKDRGWFFKP